MKTAKKRSVGLINKKKTTTTTTTTTLHVQHTFFVHFFAAVLPDYNVKLLEILIFTLVAACISHFTHSRYRIFMLFF